MILKAAIQNPIFSHIAQTAAQLNIETYVVGGYVRDYLLKKNKLTDIDITVVGDGIFFAQKLSQFLPKKTKVQVFKTYGTAMMKYNDMQVEFVGARKESYQFDTRNPKVSTGSLFDDLSRRDFTINALAISLNQSNFGELIDLFEGVKHLDERILKTPLDPVVTFSDDPLRMMRAIRFASQLSFSIEMEALNAIKKNVGRIKIITEERINTEINKILMSNQPSIGFKMMDDTGLLALIIPELIALKGVDEIEGERHKDNFYHTLEVVDNIAKTTENLWLRWSALLHDIGKAPTKKFDKKIGWTFHGHEYVGSKMVFKLFKRLKLPLNETVKYVQKMVLMSSRPIAIVDNVTDAAVRRLVFDAGDDIEELMTLCDADVTTKNPKKFIKYRENFQIVRAKIIEVEERDRIRNFQPPISGELIMQTFGISPSREIGVIKEAIKEAILEGEIPNEYDICYEYMLKKGTELGLKVV